MRNGSYGDAFLQPFGESAQKKCTGRTVNIVKCVFYYCPHSSIMQIVAYGYYTYAKSQPDERFRFKYTAVTLLIEIQAHIEQDLQAWTEAT
jgi:hypothetical protein